MRTFIVSIPKSGTYLMRELLDQLGLDGSYLHISEQGTYDYSKVSFEEGRKNPKSCLNRMSLEQSLNNIPENSFAVGHLKYSARVAKLLKPFNVIFIGRDAKETLLSYMLYGLQTGRAVRKDTDRGWVAEQDPQKQFLKYIATNGDKILKTYSEILPWMDHDGVESFDFNKLRLNSFVETQRLATIQQLSLSDTEIKQAIESSFDKKTPTLSAKIDKTKYWSKRVHQQIDQLIKKHEINYNGH